MISFTDSYAGTSAASLLMHLFQSIDTDGNSAVSQSEFLGALDGAANTSSAATDLFNSLDTDGNGQLSQLEFTSAAQQFDPADMSILLAAQEQRADPLQNLFAQMDANTDGAIDEDEFLAAAKDSGSSLSTDQLKELFTAIDANGDGSIDGQEFAAAAKDAAASQSSAGGTGGSSSGTQGYDPLDTNKDGVVSLEELIAAGIVTESA